MNGALPQPAHTEPEAALRGIATMLSAETTVISAHVTESDEEPVLGILGAAGPRAAGAPGEYALVFESVREGYLCHYGTPRLLEGHDADLALLAGDYLYALGIERLAGLGDSAAVRELGDLISLVAECEAESRHDLTPRLWLAAAVAVGCGSDEALEAAKGAARRLEAGAGERLWQAAAAIAARRSLTGPLDRAAEAIDSRLSNLADG